MLCSAPSQGIDMPELPEVETMRRGILSVVGATIAGVEFPACQLKPISISPNRPQFRKQMNGTNG